MVPTTPMTSTSSSADDSGGGSSSSSSSPNTATAAATGGSGGATVVKPHGGSSKKRASGKLDYLDGLRGYAALTVVVDHFILFFLPSYYASVAWPGLAALGPMFYNSLYRTSSSKAESLVFPFMDGTFSVAIFFVLSGRVLVASYLAKDNPPITTIASATIRRLFRLGLPPFFMVLISWIMDRHQAFESNAQAAVVTRSPFGGSDVRFATNEETNTFRDLFRFMIAIFTDNDFYPNPLMVTYRQQPQYTYLTSVLWTLRLEFRASMIVFFVAVVLKAVPPRSRWLLYGALIFWFHMENYHYLLFILGVLLCDLEQTFAKPLKCLTSTTFPPTVLFLWALRAALAYAWFAASWWQIKYLDDTTETRLVVGSFCALALLAVSPPLQSLFRSRPFHFLGYISFSLYLWHLTVLFSLGSWTFTKLYLEQSKPYGHAVGAAGGTVLVVAVAVAYAATKIFDEPSVKFAKWVFDGFFTPYDEKNRVHRALRRAESVLLQQLTRLGIKGLWAPQDPKPRVMLIEPQPQEKEGKSQRATNEPAAKPTARVA